MEIVVAGTGMVRLPPIQGGAVEAYVLDVLETARNTPGFESVLVSDVNGSINYDGCTVVPVGSPIDKFPLRPTVSPMAHLIGGRLVGKGLVRYLNEAPHRSDRVVHLNKEVSAAYFVHFRRTREPTVFSYHNPAPDLSTGQMAYAERAVRWTGSRLVSRFISRHVDRVLVASSPLKEYLVEQAGIPAERITRLPLPVDTDRFRPRPSGVAADNRERKILFVGRLDARKGVLRLVKAMSGVDADVRLTVVGRGPLRNELLRSIEENGLSARVTLRAGLTGNELLQEYLSSTAFVFPSSLETFGRVVAEAASCGLPVVLPDIPLYSDFHSGGFTIPFRLEEPKDLVDAVERVVSDPALRDRLGAKARTYAVENCSYPVFSSKLVDVYRGLAG